MLSEQRYTYFTPMEWSFLLTHCDVRTAQQNVGGEGGVFAYAIMTFVKPRAPWTVRQEQRISHCGHRWSFPLEQALHEVNRE